MTQKLVELDIDFISLVDRGANGRRHAVLKQDRSSPMTAALTELAKTLEAVLTLPASADLTPARRMQAVMKATDELLEASATAIGKRYGSQAPGKGLAGFLTGAD